MPRVKKTETSAPATPPVPATPVAPSVNKAVLKVKHKKSGKTFDVSRSYYLVNQDKLDVVS